MMPDRVPIAHQNLIRYLSFHATISFCSTRDSRIQVGETESSHGKCEARSNKGELSP